MRRWYLFGGILATVLATDIITKSIVVGALAPGDSVSVIGTAVQWTHTRNIGGAFSLFRIENPVARGAFFFTAAAIAMSFMIYLLFRHGSDLGARVSLAMIMGGTLGNVIDRVRFQNVIDFVEVNLGFWPFDPWPIFNVADSGICIGVGLLFLRLHALEKMERRNGVSADSVVSGAHPHRDQA